MIIFTVLNRVLRVDGKKIRSYFNSNLIVVNFEEKRRKSLQSNDDSFRILIGRFANTNKQD